MCKFIFLRGGSMICDLKSNSLKIFDLIYCCSCPHPSVLSNKLNQWWSGQQPAGSLLPAACKCVQSEASLKPLELNHYINPVCQFRDNLSCCCLSFTPAACVEDTAWTRKLPKPKACLLSSWRYAGLARGPLERALTFGYVSYHSWCWLTLPIVAYSRIFVKNSEGDLDLISGFVFNVTLYFFLYHSLSLFSPHSCSWLEGDPQETW